MPISTLSWRPAMRIPRFMIALAIPLAFGTACAGASKPSTDGGSTAAQSAPHAPAKPDLPSTLPVFPSADALDRDVKATILMAATYAIGVPDTDRHPMVVAQDGSICGVQVDVSTCLPSSPTAEVTTILYSPTTFLANLQKPGDQGGPTIMQDRTIAAYMNYVLYRQAERYTDNGQPLNLLAPANDSDQSAAKLRTLQLRITGQVFCGLKQHNVVSQELAALYANYQQSSRTRAAFLSGVGGTC